MKATVKAADLRLVNRMIDMLPEPNTDKLHIKQAADVALLFKAGVMTVAETLRGSSVHGLSVTVPAAFIGTEPKTAVIRRKNLAAAILSKTADHTFSCEVEPQPLLRVTDGIAGALFRELEPPTESGEITPSTRLILETDAVDFFRGLRFAARTFEGLDRDMHLANVRISNLEGRLKIEALNGYTWNRVRADGHVMLERQVFIPADAAELIHKVFAALTEYGPGYISYRLTATPADKSGVHQAVSIIEVSQGGVTDVAVRPIRVLISHEVNSTQSWPEQLKGFEYPFDGRTLSFRHWNGIEVDSLFRLTKDLDPEYYHFSFNPDDTRICTLNNCPLTPAFDAEQRPDSLTYRLTGKEAAGDDGFQFVINRRTALAALKSPANLWLGRLHVAIHQYDIPDKGHVPPPYTLEIWAGSDGRDVRSTSTMMLCRKHNE